MSFPLHRRVSKRRQTGSAAIEMAIVFPAFFLVFYAIVTYSLIFATQHTLTLAAAEGSRAALRYQVVSGSGATAVAAALEKRRSMAQATAAVSMQWLKGHGVPEARLTTSCMDASAYACIEVIARYDYRAYPLVPPLLGTFLSLPTPATLVGRAVVQINRAHLI